MHSKQLTDLKSSLENRIDHPVNNTVTPEYLAKLDEARHYGAAS